MPLFVLIVLFALVFRLVYCFAACLRRGPQTPPFLSRYASCAHALALVALGGLRSQADPAQWLELAYAVPLGYLAHDTHLLLTEASIWDGPTVAHHFVFACLVWFVPAKYPEMTGEAFMAEISLPFLHAGWAMIKTGADRRHPQVFNAVSAALLATFLWFRVRAFTGFLLEAFDRSEWFICAPLLVLVALNWYWFGVLLNKAWRGVRARQNLGVREPRETALSELARGAAHVLGQEVPSERAEERAESGGRAGDGQRAERAERAGCGGSAKLKGAGQENTAHGDL